MLNEFDHVSLIHISPRRNSKLKRVNGEVFKAYAQRENIDRDLFTVFSHMIAKEWRERFLSLDTRDAFQPFLEEDMIYLRDRYPDLF